MNLPPPDRTVYFPLDTSLTVFHPREVYSPDFDVVAIKFQYRGTNPLTSPT